MRATCLRFMGAQRQRLRTTNPHLKTLYSFGTVSLLAGTTYGLYYGVFLYKHTFSLSILALDGLFGGFGTWLGYLAGVAAIRRFGYAWCIRAAFAIWALVSFATALLASHIAEWFIAIAIIKALPAGMFAASSDTIMLREIPAGGRSSFYQLNLALEFLVGVILPAAVGALVHSAHGYPLAFALAGTLYAAALLVPINLPRPTVSLHPREMFQILRRPLYAQQAANRTLASGFNQLNAFALTILPFLLVRNELTLGLLTSLTAAVASIVAISARKIKPHHALSVGFGAHSLRSLASIVFISGWSAPLMVGWQLLNKLATPLHDPIQQSLDVQTDSLILGRDLHARALQINILNNTLKMVGSTAAYSLFFWVTHSTGQHQRHILQVLIVSYALWRLVNLAASSYLNHHAQALAHGKPRNPEPLPMSAILTRLSPWTKLRPRFED